MIEREVARAIAAEREAADRKLMALAPHAPKHTEIRTAGNSRGCSTRQPFPTELLERPIPGKLPGRWREPGWPRSLRSGITRRTASDRGPTQVPTEVRDEDGFLLGDYKLDIVVEGILVIELKAAKNIDDAHIAQLLGYLRSTSLQHGLLINFGS